MLNHGLDRWAERRDLLEAPACSLSAPLCPPPLTAVRRLLGVRVVNPRGEWLGRLADLEMDTDDGTIAYAVVEVPVASQRKRFAVPWAALEYDLNRAALVWGVERETLERSPGWKMDDDRENGF